MNRTIMCPFRHCTLRKFHNLQESSCLGMLGLLSMNHGTAELKKPPETIQPILLPSSGFSFISVNMDRHFFFLEDFDEQPTVFPVNLFQSYTIIPVICYYIFYLLMQNFKLRFSLLFLALCKVNRENTQYYSPLYNDFLYL